MLEFVSLNLTKCLSLFIHVFDNKRVVDIRRGQKQKSTSAKTEEEKLLQSFYIFKKSGRVLQSFSLQLLEELCSILRPALQF